jgi:hypothetical protein
MDYEPAWTAALPGTRLKKSGTPRTEPLSTFLNQLPDRVGLYILFEIQKKSKKEVEHLRAEVKANRALWPRPLDGHCKYEHSMRLKNKPHLADVKPLKLLFDSSDVVFFFRRIEHQAKRLFVSLLGKVA